MKMIRVLSMDLTIKTENVTFILKIVRKGKKALELVSTRKACIGKRQPHVEGL